MAGYTCVALANDDGVVLPAVPVASSTIDPETYQLANPWSNEPFVKTKGEYFGFNIP